MDADLSEFEFQVTFRVRQRGVDANDAFDRVLINLNMGPGSELFVGRLPNHISKELFSSTITADFDNLMSRPLTAS